MINKTFVHKYNEEDALIVFSSYAKDDSSAKEMNALAWYTKHLILSFPGKRKVIFLAEKTTHSSSSFEDQGRILVIPTWQKNNIRSIASVIRVLFTFSKPKRILFQFEFNMFGNIFGPFIMLFLTMYMALRGTKVYFQIHQIVLDIASIQDQINIRNPFLIAFFNCGLLFFYRLIFLFSEKVIVTEEALATKLRAQGLDNKLYILPHHVLDEKIRSVKPSKKKTKTMLFFGYLSWYKGIDWLIDTFKRMQAVNPKLRLVVAGGKSPTLKHKKHYATYYNALTCAMKQTPGLTHTGFIPDAKVRKLFKEADVLVMPYRSFISSSGPLSWAMAQRKPVILSSALKEYMKSEDFSTAMKQANLDESELFFDLNEESLTHMVKHLKTEKLTQFATKLAEKRSQKNIALALYNILYTGKESRIIMKYMPTHKSQPRLSIAYA